METGDSARAGSRARALLGGTLVEGPRHTAHAIKTQPKSFVGLLAGTSLAGGAMHLWGLPAEPMLLLASGSAVAFQLKQNLPSVLKSQGEERWRRVGSEVIWPVALAGGTAAVGHAMEPGGGGGPVETHGLTEAALHLGEASVMAGLIAGDAPAILVTALDKREPAAGH